MTQDVTNVARTNPSFYPVRVLSPYFNAVNPSLVDVVQQVCGGSYTGFVADLAPPPPRSGDGRRLNGCIPVVLCAGGYLFRSGLITATSASARTTCHPSILNPKALQWSKQTERASIQQKPNPQKIACVPASTVSPDTVTPPPPSPQVATATNGPPGTTMLRYIPGGRLSPGPG